MRRENRYNKLKEGAKHGKEGRKGHEREVK